MTYNALSSATKAAIARQAKLKPIPEVVYSKPLNFYLGYDSSPSNLLELFFNDTVQRIEQSEMDAGYRQNRRSAQTRSRFISAVRILMLNLLHVRQLSKKPIRLALPLDKNAYSLKPENRYCPPNMTYETTMDAYKGLERIGYLHFKRGYFERKEHEQGGGERSRIWPTDRLIDDFGKVVVDSTCVIRTDRKTQQAKDEFILLKGNDGTLQEYADTVFTRQARKRLKAINKVLANHTYSIEGLTASQQRGMYAKLDSKAIAEEATPYIDYDAVALYRMFSQGSFKRGGRFYRGWWQNIPQIYRKYIRIDGVATTELDYSRYHITILYAELGEKLDFDAYDISPQVNRDTSKKAVNALISASGMPNPVEGFYEYEAEISWKQFVQLIKDKHPVLTENKMFMTGQWANLQFIDSQIAEQVMIHFVKQDIPCLPIHDSFIVARQYKEELERVMKESFKDICGEDIGVSTKY